MMVMYLPVKFEFDWTKRFELESGSGNVDEQMKRRNYTNFKRNLTMMVIYLSVKFEFDWTNRFRVRVRKMKMWMDIRMDRQTDKKWTNERMELHQFRKEPSYDGDVSPVKFEFDRTQRFRVRVQKQKC